MANHCIDVRCQRCDRSWCCLCGDTYNEGDVRRTVEQAERLMRGRITANEVCRTCKTDKFVAMGDH